ncbi:MAG TPA: hypothetical protein VK203_23475 [Nostocaceae cyanobacterium]|nr:hypothetical protein [Nostocaceae cyanobacterium]
MSFEFLLAINGSAQLWSADGKFLGVLSTDRFDPYSISNPRGNYGSVSGEYSIRNSEGCYGNVDGIYSAYNPEGLNPPIVFYQEQPVLVVSKNTNLQNQVNGLAVIDPDLLLELYIDIAHAMSGFNTAANVLINR